MSKLTIHPLLKALLDGDQTQAMAETRKLLGGGVGREQIVTEGIEEAMTQLEDKCTVEQFNLLEIMLVGRAVMGVVKDLYPMNASPRYTKGTVVVGTLEGDVHDLGKNIVKMVLTAKGYRVVDCGKDCPVEKLIDTAEQEAAVIIGVSGLITTVVPLVRQLRDILAERGLGHIKVMAGGAALKQGTTENLNVDFVAETAFDGTRYLGQITRRGK